MKEGSGGTSKDGSEVDEDVIEGLLDVVIDIEAVIDIDGVIVLEVVIVRVEDGVILGDGTAP